MISSDTEDAPASSPSRGRLAARLEVGLPLAAYLAAVLSGATYSSLGIGPLRTDPGTVGSILGTPKAIRSDEWLTQTSIELNVLSLGHSSHSPLAQSPDLIFQVSSGQPVESLFFFDTTILRLGGWLPDDMLFAASRMLPFLMLLLVLPRLLRRFGASRPQSWLAAALVVLAPASLWWSFTPVRVLAFASLGSWLLVTARDRWLGSDRLRGRLLALAAAGAGGVVLARLCTYYVPWSLTIGLPLVLATVAWILWSEHRRTGALLVAVGAVTGAVMLALTFLENRPALEALLHTVYPGVRRSGGSALPAFELFGAPGLFAIQDGSAVTVANQSEITSAFLLCGVWACLLAGGGLLVADRADRAALWALSLATLGWVTWCTVSWGSFGARLPVLNLVPAPRAAQTVGYACALILPLVLSRVGRVGPARAGFVAAGCALVTAYGVSNLQAAIPTLTTAQVWLSSLAVGALVWLVTSFKDRWFPVVLTCAALVATGYQVNPLNLGTGDLRHSPAAAQVRALGETARSEGTFIAADSPFTSALLVSNGAPSLTGFQPSGPREAAWRLIDRDGSDEDAWNRGASYLRMTFDAPEGGAAEFTNPTPDVIQAKVDPCLLRSDGVPLGYVVSGRRLDRSCLRPAGSFRWSGQRNYVYEVAAQ